MGVYAVAGGEDVGQVRAHCFVHNNGALDAEFGAGVGGQLCVGPHSDYDENEIDCARDRLAVLAGSNGECAAVGMGDRGDRGVGEDFDTVAFKRSHYRFALDVGAAGYAQAVGRLPRPRAGVGSRRRGNGRRRWSGVKVWRTNPSATTTVVVALEPRTRNMTTACTRTA